MAPENAGRTCGDGLQFSTGTPISALGADASIVVLAGRHQTLDILTLDERHFRAISGPRDRPFRLLPADA